MLLKKIGISYTKFFNFQTNDLLFAMLITNLPEITMSQDINTNVAEDGSEYFYNSKKTFTAYDLECVLNYEKAIDDFKHLFGDTKDTTSHNLFQILTNVIEKHQLITVPDLTNKTLVLTSFSITDIDDIKINLSLQEIILVKPPDFDPSLIGGINSKKYVRTVKVIDDNFTESAKADLRKHPEKLDDPKMKKILDKHGITKAQALKAIG